MSSYVSRINQLDAVQLDDEIHRIFVARAQEISRLFTPGTTDKWSPEINAGLRSLIWIFSLGTGKSTFGQKLLDLTYIDLTRAKSLLILILSVLPKYLEDKYVDPNRISLRPRDKILKNYLERIFNIFNLLSFINLLLFLNRGTQPTILERLLGISSRNIASTRPRTIGYSYMTRELLWHGLMELFTIGLPLINFHYLKRCFRFSRRDKPDAQVIPVMTGNTLCPQCDETPVLPRHAGCSHIYCYYCISAQFKVYESFECVACGTELHLRNMKTYSVAS
ncbi:peroxisome biogenesis factor 2 [Fopius arisanus]|uniref:RING-type E3 ubiquitin transferase (cysteine targeting) n=1 Tax=Fopius arisanus TaxID=64838 RepID=A0A0C9RV27_9HYME|nr:PREDICTED: peroxisome biogenesis factor 2 [Fopius arisanus]XP_011304514.1 PREDICTED: peroxisome biogenesis factor 2 [Fopius arisanus]XP_011304515.1 PREDICTED: peroxisome biogenesis factor 2 [Fopius arisanus]XP_011304516.1 PREDICTED: peroxisome biogenesis factor 2 [Fopius arisanus]